MKLDNFMVVMNNIVTNCRLNIVRNYHEIG